MDWFFKYIFPVFFIGIFLAVLMGAFFNIYLYKDCTQRGKAPYVCAQMVNGNNYNFHVNDDN